MNCSERKYTGTVAEYPRESYLRHIAHFHLMAGVRRTIERNQRCGLRTVSITIEDEIGTAGKQPVAWLAARIFSK